MDEAVPFHACMAIKVDWQVRSAAWADQRQIDRLVSFGSYVHRHLDWRSPLDWIGTPPYLVIEQAGIVTAALACPPDPPQIAWIRLFAVSTQMSLQAAWQTLWDAARGELAGKGRFTAAVILLQNWYRQILEESEFFSRQQIVMLECSDLSLPASVSPVGISIRAMMPYDLPKVAEVDAMAFEPLWQNSPEALNRAYPQAVSATVAESDHGVVGYQLSTRNPFGAHLARLAVRPEVQRCGIGHALVADLTLQLARRGITRLTVNTQSDNPVSLSLYRKAGFRETGERYPVYEFQIQ